MADISVSKLNNKFTKFFLALNTKFSLDSEFVRLTNELNGSALYDFDLPAQEISMHAARTIDFKRYGKEPEKDIKDFENFVKNPDKGTTCILHEITIDNYNFDRFQLLQRIILYRDYIRVLKINWQIKLYILSALYLKHQPSNK